MLVSTSTLGGHVDTIGSLPSAGRRRRRLHSDEFKADAVAAASQPGVSMASVALARGVNANLLRRGFERQSCRRRDCQPALQPWRRHSSQCNFLIHAQPLRRSASTCGAAPRP